MSLPTPDLSHLTQDDFEHVYEPQEDTFLLLDALQDERDYLCDTVDPQLCVEIGCGSGCVITFLAQLLGDDRTYVGTDLNPNATRALTRTAKANGVHVHAVNTEFTRGLGRLAGHIDVLIFNPPYVPTTQEEYLQGRALVTKGDITMAWAGGPQGRAELDPLLPLLPHLLSPHGCFYLVAVKENKLQDIAVAVDAFGMHTKVVRKRRAKNELLYILRITWKPSQSTSASESTNSSDDTSSSATNSSSEAPSPSSSPSISTTP